MSKYESKSLLYSKDLHVTFKSETAIDRRASVTCPLQVKTLQCHSSLHYKQRSDLSSVTLQCHNTRHSPSLAATQTLPQGPAHAPSLSHHWFYWGWYRFSSCSPLSLPWDTFLVCNCLHVYLLLGDSGFLRSAKVFFHVPRIQEHTNDPRCYSVPARWMRTTSEAHLNIFAERNGVVFDSSCFCWTRVNKDLVHSNKVLN